MDLAYDDLIFVLNAALGFVASALGWEFSTVYNVFLGVVGIASLYAARKTGALARWTAVKSYRVGKWMVSGPELSELGKLLLKHLKENIYEFRSDGWGMRCGNVSVCFNRKYRVSSVQVKVGNEYNSVSEHLNSADCKALSAVVKYKHTRWTANKNDTSRAQAVVALTTPAKYDCVHPNQNAPKAAPMPPLPIYDPVNWTDMQWGAVPMAQTPSNPNEGKKNT